MLRSFLCVLFSVGAVIAGLGLQADPLVPLKPLPVARTLSGEQESPSAACSFPQTPSPTLQGLSMPLMGPVMGSDGPLHQGTSLLGEPPKDVNIPQGPFINSSIFSAGGNGRPHPYRRRPTLSNLSNQPVQNMQTDFSLRYQEPYAQEFSHLLTDPLTYLYEQQENLHTGALGFGQQVSQQHYNEAFSRFGYSPSPLQSSFFTSGPEAVGNSGHSHLNRAVGMPPNSHTNYPPGLGAVPKVNADNQALTLLCVFKYLILLLFQTPIGSHKRVFSRLIPSPEPSPEGSYVGQHSQGLGGHYADSYLKRKRIF